MERFFILDKFNTWYDWRLLLTAKDVTPPDPKTNYVTLDGMSGSLDLSESLTGEVTYNDRTVSASFWTDNGKLQERERLLRSIEASLHGKKVKIIEPDDPDHYFVGRVKVNSSTNTLPFLEFSIECVCEPWRYAVEETTRSIEVRNNTVNLVVNNNGVKTLCPVVTVIGSIKLEFDGYSTTLTRGSYKISDLKLRQGVNVISVSGSGSLSLTYREATL